MSQKPVLTLWNEETINEADARILRTACADIPVPIDNNGIRDIDTLMEAFLVREDALGLAAPQIGIGKRIIVFRNKGFDNKSALTKNEEDYDVLINPRITQARGELVYMAEGCLSCPEIQVEVGRFSEMRMMESLILGLGGTSIGILAGFVYALLGTPGISGYCLGCASIYPKFPVPVNCDFRSLVLLFILGVLPLMAISAIPAWLAGVVDPDEAIRR